ncbi:MAG TPA: HlyD family efflux transporter periplasmic adaptor subunit [Thermomicrobiales bacterium]|nr:HlyD family efflux transporter periplasmic adaptor subunit [Thermomicrobiales bacterium]
MTWRVRLRLVVGIVLVVVVCAGLVMMLNARNARVDSRSAQLAAADLTIGTPYSGTITRQFVQLGDRVQIGQPLFELASAALQSDITLKLIDPTKVPFRITPANAMLLTATEAGQIDSLSYTQGAFVPANTAIGSIQRAGSLYVQAEFRLSPQDYARLTPDAAIDVELPSRTSITAHVRKIQVQTADGVATTKVEASSPELAGASADGLFTPGTPLTAQLHLRDDGLVARLTNLVFSA